MAKTLGPHTVNAIRQYIDDGVPLEDLDLSNANRERVRVSEKVFERLQQDPMLDILHCLRRTFGRTKSQSVLDAEVVEMFMDILGGISKKLVMHRRNKLIEQEYRIASATGDWKPLDKAISHLEKLYDHIETDEEDKNPFQVPPVFVRVDILDPTKKYYDEEETQKLTSKYGGHVDPLMQMVNDKADLLKARMNDNDMEEAMEIPYDDEE